MTGLRARRDPWIATSGRGLMLEFAKRRGFLRSEKQRGAPDRAQADSS